jgi:F-type H+-transporting ATPase subunit b
MGLIDAEFIVAICFLLFIGVLIYVGAHSRLGAMIDARTDRIRRELDEARRLRQEAEELLDSYRKKAKQAEADAAAIVASAKTEAELLAKEAAERLHDFVTRRSRQAEQRIALAETQAAADVRAAAADAAIEAARRVIQSETRGEAGAQIVLKELAQVRRRLH